VFTPAPTAASARSKPRLKKEGDHWENDAYATAKVKVRVDVQGGIGSITLIGDSD